MVAGTEGRVRMFLCSAPPTTTRYSMVRAFSVSPPFNTCFVCVCVRLCMVYTNTRERPRERLWGIGPAQQSGGSEQCGTQRTG